MSTGHAELFALYYAPLLPVLLLTWLWALSVGYFERHGVQYAVCFSRADQAVLPTSRQLASLAAAATLWYLTSAAVFSYQCVVGALQWAAMQPWMLYVGLVGGLIAPVNVLAMRARLLFVKTLLRSLVPIFAVSWADFLLADMLTSLAKPMADLSRATCHLARRDIMAAFDQGCEGMVWFMPFVAAIPFVCRLVQCLRVFRDTGATPQLYNALKYASALPAMWVWGLRGPMDPEAWTAHFQALYVLVAAGCTVFSYFWDVERDWELGYFSAPKGKRPPFPIAAPTLPRELLYAPDFYYFLMISNLVLRFLWLTRLVPAWAASWVVCCAVSCLEVCRRSQWAFVRVEVELRKIQQQRPELGRLVPAVAPYHVVADGNAGRVWDAEALEAMAA